MSDIEEEPPPSEGHSREELKDIPKTEKKKKINPKLAKKKIEILKKKYEKKGIIYISRLPPHMVNSNYACGIE